MIGFEKNNEMNVISIEGLRKSFNGNIALDGISMTVRRGDIYGFLGPNGAGKTTTLRIILGVLKADKGKISVLNNDLNSWGDKLRYKVNALPESHGFYGWMNAVDYLNFFGELYGMRLTKKDYQLRLSQVRLNPHNNLPVRTFSRGMKQRLGIARSMVNNPEILFLDEPTNGLDPRGRRDIHDLLVRLNEENDITIIISTHILDDVERLCNRIAILNHGKIRYEGILRSVSNEKNIRYRFLLDHEQTISTDWKIPGVTFVEIKDDQIICELKNISPADVIKAFIDSGVKIVEAQKITEGLEEMYFGYTGGKNQ